MLKETKVLMDKSVHHFGDQLAAIRSGTITPGVIDSVRVNYHGQTIDISHLATTIRESGRIKVQPYDPSCLGEVDDALKKEGFNSYIFSKTEIVVPLAAVQTQAEREKVENRINKLAEEARIAIRNIRQKFRKGLDKEELKESDKPLQKLTDDFIKEVDKMTKLKLASL